MKTTQVQRDTVSDVLGDVNGLLRVGDRGHVAYGMLRAIIADANRCAELETENQRLQSELDDERRRGNQDRAHLDREIERLKAELANCTQCGQLDEMLRQSKDDYELALQENDRIRRLLALYELQRMDPLLQEENTRLLDRILGEIAVDGRCVLTVEGPIERLRSELQRIRAGLEKVRALRDTIKQSGNRSGVALLALQAAEDALQTAGLEG